MCRSTRSCVKPISGLLITAIISPFYDIEYNPQPPQVFTFGDGRCRVSLPSGQSYSSFALLPLLTFATRRKCLFVGGPGRGKTASAVLMGILAGYAEGGAARDSKRSAANDGG